MNLAGRSGVQLKFWASEQDPRSTYPPVPLMQGGADYDGIAISRDGVTWSEVKGLRDVSQPYAEYTVDLDAAMTALGWSYTSGFRIRFNAYLNGWPVPNSSAAIMIDDISISASAVTPGSVTLTPPPQITEGGLPQTVTLTLNAPAAADTLVTLTSSAPGKLTVPASIIVTAGQTIATFDITSPEDALLDGHKSVFITATPPAGAPGSAALTVVDNDVNTVTIVNPPAATEGGAAVTGQIVLGRPAAYTTVVALTSSDTGEAAVPASITLAPWQTTAPFGITPVDDALIDGPQTVILTAAIGGTALATGTVMVNDNEPRALQLGVDSYILEGQTLPSVIATVNGGIVESPLTVTITTGAGLSAPATITIPAGAFQAPFNLTAINDSIAGENRSATITATAPGFSPGSRAMPIYEDDPHHFDFAAIGTQNAGQAFDVIVRARTPLNQLARGHSGTVDLAGQRAAGAFAITPAITTAFYQGEWYGTVTSTTAGTGITLTASRSGLTGASSAFTINPGALHHFGFGVIPSPQRATVPFGITLTAQDTWNNTVPSFTGTAALTFTPRSVQVGSDTAGGRAYPMPAAQKSRTQMIVTAGQMSGARRIGALALNLHTMPVNAITGWTIRLRHTTLASHSPAAWEASGWTTVHTGTVAGNAFGWVTFSFSAPFDYDGSRNLMVDLSFDKPAAGTSSEVEASQFASGRTLYASTSSAGIATPTQWSGPGGGGVPVPLAVPWVPNMQFFSAAPSVSPALTGAFAAGAWTGPVTIGAADPSASLTATGAGITSQSMIFTVLPWDTDGDGLPDTWETAHGLDPNNNGSSNPLHGPHGDGDSDGLTNLIEYALYLDPRVPNPDAAPRTAFAVNPADGQQYATLTYRRRTGSGFSFQPATSSDLLAWDYAPSGYTLLSAVPNPGGLTENVTVRLLPSTALRPRRYMRLRVSTN